MGHWLRKLPGVDKNFIAEHIIPVEALQEERTRLTKSIVEAETAAVRAAKERWTPVKVSECHAKYMSK
ncbi:hypothetical protein [Agrobacterium tumefaciens]|uniref:hypothetical protein n=1 Tax=Agrobacterium tumefaciens TaxID=358 RepID=UPI0015744DB3|nr:hypothetical protein [Agrobacterium tumefaciens]NSX94389.1 hypothetical protein [Agrobacterium tumefaciens]